MKKSIYPMNGLIIIAVILLLSIVGCATENNVDDNIKEDNIQEELQDTSENNINNDNMNTDKKKEPEKTADDDTAFDSKEMEETTIYKAGMYKIGSDMPSGEYVIQATDSNQSGYFEIAKDSSGEVDSIIANDIIANNSYITVNEGEFLRIDLAVAIPIEEAQPFEAVNGRYPTGMYKVGYDISPGEYKVIMHEDEDALIDSGYFEITSDSRHAIESIITNDSFESNAYIHLKEGQYLKLNDAYIEAKQG